MKRTSLISSALIALGMVFASTGCSTLSTSAVAHKGPATYALIVSVSGGQAPTDAQWATMQKDFAALLASRGLVLVTDPTFADKLIQVLFVPDLTDPSDGISYIVGVRDNPGALLATTSRPSSASFSYSYLNQPGFSSYAYSPQYYGYFTDYYPDTSYSSTPPPVGNRPATPPPHPGGGHHISRPVDCPPDNTAHRPSPGYAGTHPPHSNPPDGGNHWWSRHPTSEPSTSGYSATSYSSSSDFVGPTTSYSSSASVYSPPISFPSSSDTSSSSSYSPPVQMSMPASSSNESSSRTISFPDKQ